MIALDDVQVAVGESADVRCRLADRRLLAELVAERVSLAYTRRQQLNLIVS